MITVAAAARRSGSSGGEEVRWWWWGRPRPWVVPFFSKSQCLRFLRVLLVPAVLESSLVPAVHFGGLELTILQCQHITPVGSKIASTGGFGTDESDTLRNSEIK